MIDSLEYNNLQNHAKNIRRNIVEMVHSASSGHPGGSLSIADILSVLYFHEMNVNVNNPKDENRDRLVLSKGHCSPALYSALAEKGFFPEEDLKTFRKIDSYLQGHPDMKKIPGVDMTSGSLGQGLSVANGMALAGKLDKKNYRVYCIMGDGEIEEGQIWEAAMSSSKYKLDNLCAIVDNNNLQIDGHNFEEIINAFDEAKKVKEKPTVIIAKTTKGKGVSYMENQVGWHGKAPNDEEYKIALEDLK